MCRYIIIYIYIKSLLLLKQLVKSKLPMKQGVFEHPESHDLAVIGDLCY